MSEGPKISRSVLIAELVVGVVYAGLMALRASGFPPSVRATTSVSTFVMVCSFFFVLTVGAFNLSYLAGARRQLIWSWVLLVCAVLLVLWLLMISLAQY